MIGNTLRSEWIRIWRWSFLIGGIGVPAAFAALISVFIYTAADDITNGTPVTGPGGGPGSAASFATTAQLAEPGGFLTPLATVSTLAGIVLLAMSALAVATDYSTGLIRILVQAQPKRTILLTGKILALAVFTLISTLVTTLVVVLVARPLARLHGIDVDAWKTDVVAHLASSYLNFIIAATVWGLIGLMIAVLTRSAALAIGIGIGYLLVVENLIGIVAPDATTYLPGGTLNALVAGGTNDLTWTVALGLTVLYGTIATAIAIVTFRARSITA